MNNFLASGFVMLLALTFLFGQSTSATETVNLSKLAETGKLTFQKLENAPATWMTRCRITDEGHMEVKVSRHGRRQSWSFSRSVRGLRVNICDVIQLDGIWHVMGDGHFLKCRPYEVELPFPVPYFFFAAAEIQCFTDNNPLGALEFEKRNGSRLWFRLQPRGDFRRAMEKALAESNKLDVNNLTFEQRTEKERVAAWARDYLTNGSPVAFDETTGILLEGATQSVTFSVEGFRWLDHPPENAFDVPRGVQWNDQTFLWSATDYEHCVMVSHDPLAVGKSESSSPDTFLLNLKSGQMRRVPFVGVASLPGCFVASRSAVVVGGIGVNNVVGLTRVDLATGRNKPFAAEWLSGGPLLIDAVSPDGQHAVVIFATSDMEPEVRLINVNDGSFRILDKSGRLGGPSSWLPDGTGIILKRLEPAKKLNRIEQRILCRLDLDGTLKDLRPGHSPLVLRKSRKILYRENESQLWHTCDLDGSNPKLYADGLAGHRDPAVSPDESQILFTQVDKGSAPRLMLFELGKTNGQPAMHADGFTGRAVWR